MLTLRPLSSYASLSLSRDQSSDPTPRPRLTCDGFVHVIVYNNKRCSCVFDSRASSSAVTTDWAARSTSVCCLFGHARARASAVCADTRARTADTRALAAGQLQAQAALRKGPVPRAQWHTLSSEYSGWVLVPCRPLHTHTNGAVSDEAGTGTSARRPRWRWRWRWRGCEARASQAPTRCEVGAHGALGANGAARTCRRRGGRGRSPAVHVGDFARAPREDGGLL